jgi:hypothetical protein
MQFQRNFVKSVLILSFFQLVRGVEGGLITNFINLISFHQCTFVCVCVGSVEPGVTGVGKIASVTAHSHAS